MAVDVRIITQISGSADVKNALNQIAGGTDKVKKRTKEATDIFTRLKNTIKSAVPEVDVLVKGFVAFKAVQAALSGVVSVIGSIITETSNARETTQKFDAVFKDLAETTRQWASDTAEALNRSDIDLQAYLATLQDTFVPMGFARDKAAEMAKQLVILGADLAAFNNEADADVINALTSAMVGNTEAVRRYGIDLSKAALEQEILNSGLADSFKNATRQQKAMASLNIILRSSADATGTARKEADGFAGQMRALESATRDLMVALGESGLIQIATKLVTALASVAKTSAEVVETLKLFSEAPVDAAKSLGKAIEDFIIGKLIKWRENILILTKSMSLLFTGEFGKAIQTLNTFNEDVQKAAEVIDDTAKAADKATEAMEDLTKATEDNEDAVDDATRAQIEHFRRLNDGLAILRQQQDAERRAGEATKARAQATKQASKEATDAVADEARQRCGFEKQIDECGNETWVKSRSRSQRLTKELIRNAEGVKIFACKVAKEQEKCVTENQIIIEKNIDKSNKRIRKSWEDMLEGITGQTRTWKGQILEVVQAVIAEIISAIGQSIDVQLHFDLSVSGAGGTREEEEISRQLGAALGEAFGTFVGGPLGGRVGGLVGEFAGPLLEDALGGLSDVLGDFGDFLSDALGGVGDLLGDALGGIGDFLGFQRGGDFVASRPTLIGVGEAGAERVRITPLGAHGGGGSTIVFQGPTVIDGIGMRRFTRSLDHQINRRRVRGV